MNMDNGAKGLALLIFPFHLTASLGSTDSHWGMFSKRGSRALRG